jgi:hypothetical protein
VSSDVKVLNPHDTQQDSKRKDWLFSALQHGCTTDFIVSGKCKYKIKIKFTDLSKQPAAYLSNVNTDL